MNRVHGHIKRLSTGHTLYEITGGWDDKLYIKNMQVRLGRRFSFSRSFMYRPKIHSVGKRKGRQVAAGCEYSTQTRTNC
jgi:hypothetical protein